MYASFFILKLDLNRIINLYIIEFIYFKLLHNYISMAITDSNNDNKFKGYAKLWLYNIG